MNEKKTKVVTLKPHVYASVSHRPGEIYDAEPDRLEAIIAMGLVKRVETSMEPVPAGTTTGYKRRDMRAQK